MENQTNKTKASDGGERRLGEVEIWEEGLLDNGGNANAKLLGKYFALDFDDAVRQHIETKKSDREFLNYYRYDKNTKTHSFWACRWFDNEKDARQSFG